MKFTLKSIRKILGKSKEAESKKEDKLIKRIISIGYYVERVEEGFRFILGHPRKFVIIQDLDYLSRIYGEFSEIWSTEVSYDGFSVYLRLFDFNGKLILYVDYPIDIFSRIPWVFEIYREIQHSIPIDVKIDVNTYYNYVKTILRDLIREEHLANITASLFKIFIIEPYKLLDPLIHAHGIQEVNTFAIIKPGIAPGTANHIVQITHAKYGPVDTNLIISEDHLQDLVMVIAKDCGKSISKASPRIDVVDKYGNRINLELFSIECNLGSRIAIRVHPHEFLPPPMYFAEMNPSIGTNLPIVLNVFTQYKTIGCIFGGMGSGKTTFMTIVMSLYDPSTRIGMISDIPEMFMQIPHPYKHATLVRNVQEYEYVIASMLRANLDVVTLGEVRTAIEYREFINASATHGGLTTIHANTEETLYSRLNSFEKELGIYPPFPPFKLITGISRAFAFEKGRKVTIRYIRGVWYVQSWRPKLKLVPLITFNPDKRVHVIHDENIKLYLKDVSESSGISYENLEKQMYYLDELIKLLSIAWKVSLDFRKEISNPDKWLQILSMAYGTDESKMELLSTLDEYGKFIEEEVEEIEFAEEIVSERVNKCPRCGSPIVDERKTSKGIVLICEKGHEILLIEKQLTT